MSLSSVHIVTLEAIQAAIQKTGSLRRFEKKLGVAYNQARRKNGARHDIPFTLSFDDSPQQTASLAAQYLYDRGFGGPSWRGSPDSAMMEALKVLLRSHRTNSSRIKSASPRSSPSQSRAQTSPQVPNVHKSSQRPPIRRPHLTGDRVRAGSPSQDISLSATTRLLLGVTQPERESEEAVLEFLTIVRDANESGSNATRNLTLATGLPRQQLNKLASRFLYPSAEILQLRVDRILTQHPEQRMEVARAFAADIRSAQEEDQQILSANQQLSRSLAEAIRTMNIDPAERDRLRAAIRQLDATRGLAVREINSALREANLALVESGAAGPSRIAKVLLGK